MIACLSPLIQRRQAVRNFAFWLRHYVKSNAHDPIQTEVSQLTNVSGNVTEAMQKASELISRHTDRFNIPLRNSQETTAGIFVLLQNEWNLFHQSTATSHSPVLERCRHSLTGKFGTGLAPVSAARLNRRHRNEYSSHMSSVMAVPSIQPAPPLASGIAIGAP